MRERERGRRIIIFDEAELKRTMGDGFFSALCTACNVLHVPGSCDKLEAFGMVDGHWIIESQYPRAIRGKGGNSALRLRRQIRLMRCRFCRFSLEPHADSRSRAASFSQTSSLARSFPSFAPPPPPPPSPTQSPPATMAASAASAASPHGISFQCMCPSQFRQK